jgi:hypothetical protein
MRKQITQASAEQAVHEAIDNQDSATLQAYAEFAAGEIDDKHIAALLLAMLAKSPRQRSALMGLSLHQIEQELDRLRAHFTEAAACKAVSQYEAEQMRRAEGY